jgi:hypothetical protein
VYFNIYSVVGGCVQQIFEKRPNLGIKEIVALWIKGIF